MKLSEAIKEIGEMKDGCGPEMPESIIALMLGIEALKEIDHLRQNQVLDEDELLPGETT